MYKNTLEKLNLENEEILKWLESLNIVKEMDKAYKILKLEPQHTQEPKPTTEEPEPTTEEPQTHRITSNIIISLCEDIAPKQENKLLLEVKRNKTKSKPLKFVDKFDRLRFFNDIDEQTKYFYMGTQIID